MSQKQKLLRQNPFSNYTEAALTDEVVDELLGKNDYEMLIDEVGREHILVYHPYINQAEGLLRTINVKDPLPEFVVWLSDISSYLEQELKRLDKSARNHIMTDAVRIIYETIDPHYYRRNAIRGKVKWRFGDG
jgi:hypothetical protein